MTIKFKHQLLNLLVSAASDCIKLIGPTADEWNSGPKALCAFHKIVSLGYRAHESDEAFTQLIAFCKSLGFGSEVCGGDRFPFPYFDPILFTFLHTIELDNLELVHNFVDSFTDSIEGAPVREAE